ncbi:substrate-binding domain-containing protein [Oceanimonas baumannii]|uniref:substrate-binding domain-containing protein n=1 Tax=Oceanimonas baumannii TaxID=129578 RepID=UPI001D192BCB|nr:substrate-binding domain-containing protein [Oceanimonas baumannii]MCC4264540.1 substrate-binding domain-containing protein [Oceanimonas baumannii]
MLVTRLLLTVISFMLFASSCALANSGDYWTYQEYMEAFPEQHQRANSFAERVRQPVTEQVTSTSPPLRIAMLTPDAQASDYWWRNRISLTRRLQETGLTFSLTSYSFQPATTIRQQEQLLADALRDDPDYLIFTLNALRHRVLVEKILARGHPKLILMNITTPLKHWAHNQPFFYVGFDHREGTRQLKQAINKMTGPTANYLMLYGTQGYVSEVRGDEFIQLNADMPGYVLSNAFYTDVKRDKAQEAVLRSLAADSSINLIYACTTDIALGAADALKQLGKENDIVINGWGGGTAELDAIADGRLDVTVMRMNDDNGIAIAEAIRLDQENKTDKIPLIYSGDFAIVDRQTPATRLEQLKAHAFRYSQ